MYAKPEEPDAPDHYSALGVSPDATDAVVKRTFQKLALKFHPDKQAPGQTVDAVEFRKVSTNISIYTHD
jgi:curved DNA-binding protein CbpA